MQTRTIETGRHWMTISAMFGFSQWSSLSQPCSQTLSCALVHQEIEDLHLCIWIRPMVCVLWMGGGGGWGYKVTHICAVIWILIIRVWLKHIPRVNSVSLNPQVSIYWSNSLFAHDVITWLGRHLGWHYEVYFELLQNINSVNFPFVDAFWNCLSWLTYIDICKMCLCQILVLLCTCFAMSTKMVANCKPPIGYILTGFPGRVELVEQSSANKVSVVNLV